MSRQSRFRFVDLPSSSEVKKEEPIPEITETMDVIDVAHIVAQRNPSWAPVFKDAEAELQRISDLLKVDEEKNGYFVPERKNLFRAFELTPLDQVRVVIFGQDPYPAILEDGKPRAQGLAFSVRSDDVIPVSLRNIFKEISNDYPGWTSTSGDLSRWSKQGVLLLNACLTCPRVANGHAKYLLWFPFILKVLAAIAKVRPKCIYVMWGDVAQKLQRHLGDRAITLVSGHPAARRRELFFNHHHFLRINQYLESFGEPPIKW